MKELIRGIRFFFQSEGPQKAKLFKMILLLLKFSILVKFVP